ncbi:MAG: toll/interleukin-1 receptor domain-containing protein, partial [Planctomycetales bacterium]|nr:toll/interleukin-1 receptor domain-containing protein [Planctomycetales bacterium]
MSNEVFISYSSHDSDVANQICAAVEESGTLCWIAPRDVMPGESYGEALIDAINSCRVMVLVLSPNSNHSPQVVREVERAVSKGIPIIPFRIAEVRLGKSLEYFLSSSQWLDAFGDQQLERRVPQLVEAVNEILRRVYDGKTLRMGPLAAPPKSRSILRRGAPADDHVEAEEVIEAELVARRPTHAPPPFDRRSGVDRRRSVDRRREGNRPTNSLAVAGLTTSILGMFTCGTFSPIGFLLSLI